MKSFICSLLFLLTALPMQAQKEFHGDGIDDYLRFVPMASAYVLKMSGVQSASSWKRLMVNSAVSLTVSLGVAYGLKQTVHEWRPDGTDRRAFPSGHATLAFAGATILYKEFGHVSPWISVAGYGVSAFTAVDRVRRNRHDWGDVAAGAASGVGGVLLGYWIGDRITGERRRCDVALTGSGVCLVYRF